MVSAEIVTLTVIEIRDEIQDIKILFFPFFS